VTDFNQPCADGFSVGDGIIKSATLNLFDCTCPSNSLYPSGSLYPGVISITDTNTNVFTIEESENFTATDSHVMNIVKNVNEGGLRPSTSLYPLTTLYPNSGILVLDRINKITSKNVSENGAIGDVIGPFAIVKGAADNIDFLDEIRSGIVKYLNDSGNIIDLSIYNIGKNINDNVIINDIFTTAFTSYLKDSVGISDGIVKSIVKYLNECGLTPYNTLYPSGLLYPNSGIKMADICSANPTVNLSDEFSIIDAITRAIIKDIPDNINISDNILFNTILYLEENSTILDEISKGGYKSLSLSDQVDLVDNVTKNIISIISENIDINDKIETILMGLPKRGLIIYT
jgi:hypothetical protein